MAQAQPQVPYAEQSPGKFAGNSMVDPFVHGHMLSPGAFKAVFHDARELFDFNPAQPRNLDEREDSPGVRVSHVMFTLDLLKYQAQVLTNELAKSKAEGKASDAQSAFDLQRLTYAIDELTSDTTKSTFPQARQVVNLKAPILEAPIEAPATAELRETPAEPERHLKSAA